MPYVEPIDRAESSEHEPLFELVEQAMGFLPNSILTMARVPGLAPAFATLAGTIQTTSLLDPGTVQLVAHVASRSAGCRYCQAHTAEQAVHRGVEADLIEHVWEFETDERFSAARRAALRLARDAAQVPNVVGPEHFADLADHYDEDQIAALVAVVSLFGFLNRWNDTMATALEEAPARFAGRHLSDRGWTVGKHA